MKYGRLPWWSPDELSESQRAYYYQLAAGPRKSSEIMTEDGRLKGPFNARLLHPELGTALQELSAVLRFKTPALSDRCRELTILETANHEQAEYEWNSHRRIGIGVGLTNEEIDAIRNGRECPTFDSSEQLVRLVVRSLLENRDLDDQLYDRAEKALGPVMIFDIVSLVGHYQHTALAMRVWRVPLPEGVPPTFVVTPSTQHGPGSEGRYDSRTTGVGS